MSATSDGPKLHRSGFRRKTKQRRVAHRHDGLTAFEAWSVDVQAERDPTRRDLLIEFGEAEGWVGPDGEVLDPNATERDQLNASLRRAAGLAPCLRTLFGDRGSS